MVKKSSEMKVHVTFFIVYTFTGIIENWSDQEKSQTLAMCTQVLKFLFCL